MKKLQCCRLKDQGVERSWVDGLSRKALDGNQTIGPYPYKHGQCRNGSVDELWQRRLHKVHIQQTFQDMLRTEGCMWIQQENYPEPVPVSLLSL